MLRRLLFLVLAVVGIFWWLRGRLKSRSRASTGPPQGGEMVRDRICNTFLPRSRALTLKIGSGQEFFCSERCKETFLSRTETSV